MAFETLADRFNRTRGDIYARFSNGEQLVEIKPNSPESRERVIDDTRSLPLRSTRRDITRISRFLVTDNPGLLFLGKQLLLQTGNTFAETRIYNPTSPLVNVVPFLHYPRQFRPPTTGRGALQEETVYSFNQPPISFRNLVGQQIRNVVRTITSPIKTALNGPKKGIEDKFYLRPEENVPQYRFLVAGTYTMFRVPLFDVQTLSRRGEKKIPLNTRVIVDGKEKLNNFAWYAVRANSYSNRIAFNRGTPRGSTLLNTVEVPAITDVQQFSSIGAGARSLDGLGGTTPKKPRYGLNTVDENGNRIVLDFNTRFQRYTQAIKRTSRERTNGYFQGRPVSVDTYQTIEDSSYQTKKTGFTGLADAYNRIEPVTGSLPHRVSYDSLVHTPEFLQGNKDIIKFIFKDVNQNEAIHFRALLSELRQNTRADYNETKYIGRTERFVNYSGAKRSVNMSFNIVAFSQMELDNMWLRINYLTGLAFPRGVSDSGFMIPPLFRITMGDINADQPCYIETLDFDFLDNTITFDIDKEVSQVINVKLSLVLLEKRSKFIDSPYYGITEKLQPKVVPVPPRREAPTLLPPMVITAEPDPVGQPEAARIPLPIPPVPTAQTDNTRVVTPYERRFKSPFDGFGGGGGFSGGGSSGRIP